MPGQLLKTCQTCFRAKIKCEKSQSSGRCDRCLRLDKQCVFAPSRRRNLNPLASPVSWPRTPPPPPTAAPAVAIEPFSIISIQGAATLLDAYRSKFCHHFPFVVLSATLSVQELYEQRPLICIALLAATCTNNVKQQRALGSLFNQLVATRLMSGSFATVETLQALLIHLAWAHYQPRPRRYSQHLYLAASVVSDLRMDRPKHPRFWTTSSKTPEQIEWSPDEMRAICGLYYLSSSMSILLQKQRLCPSSDFVVQISESLAQQNIAPTDKLVPIMIRLQRLTEQVEHAMSHSSQVQHSSVQRINETFDQIKSSINFPLAESPALLLQSQLLDLLLNQSTMPANAFGLDQLANSSNALPLSPCLVQWLTESMISVKSLLSFFAVVPSDNIPAISNTEWITLYCGMSLAARMDIVSRHPSIVHATRSVRNSLQLQHVLRQAVLRLEAATGQEIDSSGDRDAFFHLLQRAKQVEDWYLAQKAEFESSSGTMSNSESPTSFGGVSAETSSTLPVDDSALMDLVANYGFELETGGYPFAHIFNFEGS